jgi:hypothetical protein
MLPNQPSNFFWVVDRLTLDGIIRSDNRGSESVFPCEIGDSAASPSNTWRANFAEQAIAQCERNTGLAWRGIGSGDLQHEFGADDLLAYVYAVFSSPAYRARYAEPLCEDFPRIPLPWSRAVLGSLARLGNELIALHLLRPDARSDAGEDRQAAPEAGAAQRVAAGFPRYRDGCVWIRPGVCLGPVPEEVWRFRVGAHQVCRKWLKDRRGDCLRPSEIARYRRILNAIQRTLEILPAIDRFVDAEGGWEIAFRQGAFPR